MTSIVGLCWRINHILAPILQFEDAFVGEQFLFRNMGPIRQWWWLCGPAFGPFCPPSKTVDQTSSLFPTMPRCELTRATFDNWLLIATISPIRLGPSQLSSSYWGLPLFFIYLKLFSEFIDWLQLWQECSQKICHQWCLALASTSGLNFVFFPSQQIRNP